MASSELTHVVWVYVLADRRGMSTADLSESMAFELVVAESCRGDSSATLVFYWQNLQFELLLSEEAVARRTALRSGGYLAFKAIEEKP